MKLNPGQISLNFSMIVLEIVKDVQNLISFLKLVTFIKFFTFSKFNVVGELNDWLIPDKAVVDVKASRSNILDATLLRVVLNNYS